MKISSTPNIFALFYGVPKAGKTTWALEPCNSNYSITVLDLENNLFPATRHKNVDNIQVIPLNWDGEQVVNPIIPFLRALRNAYTTPFVWDCTDKRKATAQLDPSHEYCRVDLKQASSRDILVLDSWSVFCNQCYAGKDNKHYSFDYTTDDYISQPQYNVFVREANAALDIIKACKVPTKVILAHEYTETGLTYPISVTKPHGQNLAAQFNLVARFKDGNIDTSSSLGGGLVSKMKKPLDNYTFSMLLSELKLEKPASFEPSKAFYFAMGDEMQEFVNKASALTAKTNVNVNLSSK